MYDILSVLDYYKLLDGSTEVSEDFVKIVCPFHNEGVASFCIDIRRGFMHCFGCSWKGDIVDLVAKIEKVDRLTAMVKMLKIKGVKTKTKLGPEVVISQKELTEGAYIQYASAPKVDWEKETDNYMVARRGFSAKTLSRFGIKIEPGSVNYPIMIPIFDNGEFSGLIRRRTDSVEDRKYINNRGFKKKNVVGGSYGAGAVMVCEGPLDMMKAYQYGYKNVVCIFGWKISKSQASKIAKHTDTVIDALDNSPKGEEGGAELRKYFKRVLRLQYPPGAKDICEMSKSSFRKAVIDTLE
jgi:DNA primase